MGAVISAFWHCLHHYLNLSETRTERHKEKQTEEPNIAKFIPASSTCNSNTFDASERRRQVLENVMKELADPNTH